MTSTTSRREDETEPAATPEPPMRRGSALVRRWRRCGRRVEAGMSTTEYAVGTVAACAFAAVLYRVVTGGSIVTGLTKLVEAALATLS